MKIQLFNAVATQYLGNILGQLLPAGSVILLFGDLGAGKTTLVQGIGEGLGIDESIVSPTFTLINEYTQGRLPLYHLDLYRLETSEVTALNLETYWEGIEVEPGIVAIEWSQKMPYKPDSYVNIHLTYSDSDTSGQGQADCRYAQIIPFNCTIDNVISPLRQGLDLL